jgi:hypothetical protein
MATQIVIQNEDRILLDDSFAFNWNEKGNAWQDDWCPNTIHCVIWNNLPGQNEIQNKDASTGMMTGNVNLNSTSDAVGSTTIAALLTWAETRKGQIEAAITAHDTAFNNSLAAWLAADDANTNTNHSWSKTWYDYDSNF